MNEKKEQDFFEDVEQIEQKKPADSVGSKLGTTAAVVITGCILALLVAVTVKVILWIF